MSALFLLRIRGNIQLAVGPNEHLRQYWIEVLVQRSSVKMHRQTGDYPTWDEIRRSYHLHVIFVCFLPRSGMRLITMSTLVAVDERQNCILLDYGILLGGRRCRYYLSRAMTMEPVREMQIFTVGHLAGRTTVKHQVLVHNVKVLGH